MGNSRGKITKAQLSQSLIDAIEAGGGTNPPDAGGGNVNLVITKYSQTITANTDKVAICAADKFNKDKDQILVFKNSVYIEITQDYIINADNTISTIDGSPWIASTEEPLVFNFIIFATVEKAISAYESATKDILISNWSTEPNADGMYTATVTHNLKSEALFVSGINADTGKNVLLAFTIVNENTIVVEMVDKCNLKLIVIDSENTQFVDGGAKIDDINIGKETTFSSDKIDSTYAKKTDIPTIPEIPEIPNTASQIGIVDIDGLLTATDVEGALKEIITQVKTLDSQIKALDASRIALISACNDIIDI